MDGLAPAIAIKQKNQTRNPRSTVATATEIYDYLRLLYARCGTVTCLHCGGVVRHDTVDEIVAALLALRAKATRAYALFPIARAEIKSSPCSPPPPKLARTAQARKKIRRKEIRKSVSSVPAFPPLPTPSKTASPSYAAAATTASIQDGNIVEFSTPDPSSRSTSPNPSSSSSTASPSPPIPRPHRRRHRDRLPRVRRSPVPHRPPRRRRSAQPQHLSFSAAFECSTCHRAYREPEPRLFSFNNPYGACPRCQGFGNTIDFDPNLILPDRSRTLAQGAIAPWTTPKYRPFHGEMVRFASSAAIPTDVPWYDLDPAQQELLWKGAAAPTPASAASSPHSSARSISSMSASSSPITAATLSAPTAAASACAPKPAPS